MRNGKGRGPGVRALLLWWSCGLLPALPGAPLWAQTNRTTTPAADDRHATRLEDVLARAQAAQRANRYADAVDAYAEATALDSRSAELWANRGLMEYFAARYAASVASLTRASALKPALLSPPLFLGLDELKLGNAELALPHLQRAHLLQPTDLETMNALGRAYTALHQPHEAAAAYAGATAQDPNNQTSWYGLGVASMAAIEQDGGALARLHADSPWAGALFADELLVQGRNREAIDTYRRVAATATARDRRVLAAAVRHTQPPPSQAETTDAAADGRNGVLAVLQSAEGSSAGPVCPALLESATSHPAQKPLRALSATAAASGDSLACLFLQSRDAACAEAAAMRLRQAPGNPEALFWSVKANERRAVDALARFEQLAPQSPVTFDLIGDLYRRRMQPDSALPEYGKALAIAPRDPVALLGRAAALLAIGRMDEAAGAATDALTDTPQDARLNLLLSEALIERHRFAEAIPHLDIALAAIAHAGTADTAIAAYGPRAHALLGRAEAGLGEDSKAIADMLLGLQSDEDGSLTFQLSRLYRRAGKLAEARDTEEKAKQLQAHRRERAATAVGDFHAE